ncbi:TOBE domain-containing protein [Devosia sp.]|uniref:TOBE domain-containing protein n=1 Tax=Devosia sp. TaxID=1871048 RepID=UPI00292EE891|nr:TOBE domain-containing protein [Devosia sp.]
MLLWIPASPPSVSDALTAPFWRRNFVAVTPSGRTLADRIVLMRAGNIDQLGTPQEIYENPHTLFVAGFIGTPNMNFLKGTVRVSGQSAVVLVGSAEVPLDAGRFTVTDKQEVVLGVRPGDVTLVRGEKDGRDQFGAAAGLVEYHGHDTLVSMNFQGQPITALVPSKQRVAEGDMIRFQLSSDHLHLFDVASELSLRVDSAPAQAVTEAIVHKIYP